MSDLRGMSGREIAEPENISSSLATNPMILDLYRQHSSTERAENTSTSEGTDNPSSTIKVENIGLSDNTRKALKLEQHDSQELSAKAVGYLREYEQFAIDCKQFENEDFRGLSDPQRSEKILDAQLDYITEDIKAAQKESIKYYADNGYDPIFKYCRGQEFEYSEWQGDRSIQDHTATIEAALKDAPSIPMNIVLKTDLALPDVRSYLTGAESGSRSLEGRAMQDPAFLPTSYKLESVFEDSFAPSFQTARIFIKVPEGSKGLLAEPFSAHENEGEVLFARNTLVQFDAVKTFDKASLTPAEQDILKYVPDSIIQAHLSSNEA